MKILVHSFACFDPAKEEPPRKCLCEHRVRRREAVRMIQEGEAIALPGYDRQVIRLRRAKIETPRTATTIEKLHIERAYVYGDRYHKRRIETYGENHLHNVKKRAREEKLELSSPA